jgi:hypothetical protein
MRILCRIKIPIIVLGVLALGCAPARVKPQASDWAQRKLDGVSLDAPYSFTGNRNALPGYVNVASYKPEHDNSALDIRVDVLQPPVGAKAPSIDEFAIAMFALTDADGKKYLASEIGKLQIDGVDARRNHVKNHKSGIVDGLVFKKGEFYWLIEVYYRDPALGADAKRVIDSVKLQ